MVARAVDPANGGALTETGLAVGTPAYMSPEQATAERVLDGRTDLYSLACVLFEALTGEAPFAGSTARATMALHATQSPPSLRTKRADVPMWVDQAVANVGRQARGSPSPFRIGLGSVPGVGTQVE